MIGGRGGQCPAEIRETPDYSPIHQGFCNPTLIAALITSHQQHPLRAGDRCQALTQGIAPHENVIIIFEEEHANHIHAMHARLELR